MFCLHRKRHESVLLLCLCKPNRHSRCIGYVGLAYINKEVKPIHVSYDAGKTFTEPSFENAKNKAYPIVRPLFYYYDVKNEGKVKPFIDYILSAEGQATVKQVGYIPVK